MLSSKLLFQSVTTQNSALLNTLAQFAPAQISVHPHPTLSHHPTISNILVETNPVVAYRAGGALDTIQEDLNGVFCESQTVDAVAAALADPRLDRGWDAAAMQAHAETFGRERFRSRLTRAIAGAWRRHRENGGRQ